MSGIYICIYIHIYIYVLVNTCVVNITKTLSDICIYKMHDIIYVYIYMYVQINE